MAAERKMVPWRHCQLILALSRDGVDGSSANNGAQQRQW
jgi:hypothetical protein